MKLTEFTENDFDTLLQWIDSPYIFKLWGSGVFSFYPLDTNQLQIWLDSCRREVPIRAIFKAIDKATEAPLGFVELANIDLRHEPVGTICRMIVDPLWRGKGIGTEIVKKVIEVGFKEYDLCKIDLEVYDFNISAIRCYEKAGMRQEGLLRKVTNFGDEFWDAVQMGITRAEFDSRQHF